MNIFEKLYDEYENVKTRFVGFTTEHTRFDFGIIFTNLFFGKPLVICMQTGRSTLLDHKDLENTDFIQKVFKVDTYQQAEDLCEFFKETIPGIYLETQYD